MFFIISIFQGIFLLLLFQVACCTTRIFLLSLSHSHSLYYHPMLYTPCMIQRRFNACCMLYAILQVSYLTNIVPYMYTKAEFQLIYK